jgi:hypothetical protein
MGQEVCADNITLGVGHLNNHVPVNAITFVQSHNGAVSKEDGWLYYQQTINLTKQMERFGVRATKFPVHLYKPSSKTSPKTLRVCHEPDGGNNCKLSLLQRGGRVPDAVEKHIKRIADFLKSNRSEIFILKLEFWWPSGYGLKEKKPYLDQFVQMLKDIGAYGMAYKLNEGEGGTQWPTLGEMRAQNKRLIIMVDDKELVDNTKVLNHFAHHINQTHWDTNSYDVCKLVQPLNKASDHEELKTFTKSYQGNKESEEFKNNRKNMERDINNRLRNTMLEVNINSNEMSYSLPKPVQKVTKIFNTILKKVPVKKIQELSKYVKVDDYKSVNSFENIDKRIINCFDRNKGVHNVDDGLLLSSDFVDMGDNGGLQKFAYDRNNFLNKIYMKQAPASSGS